MYGKIFASMYQGTMRGKTDLLVVFTNLIAHADREGWVDIHPRAIAEETGLPEDRVRSALLELEAPDPESRSQELGGARLERIDAHRVWGWRIVNYIKYRTIRDQEERRDRNRMDQANRRARIKGSAPSAASENVRSCQMMSDLSDRVRSRQAMSAHAEEEAKEEAHADAPTVVSSKTTGDAKAPTAKKAKRLTDEEFLAKIKADPTYAGIDIDRALGKCRNWCEANGQQANHRRFINWLNNERPIATNGRRRPESGQIEENLVLPIIRL